MSPPRQPESQPFAPLSQQHPMPDATAQLSAMLAQYRARIDESLIDMKVREWCIERAVEVCKGDQSVMLAGEKDSVVLLAEQILLFISQPFSAIFREQTQEPEREPGPASGDDRNPRKPDG